MGQFLPAGACLGMECNRAWSRGKHFPELQDTKVRFANTLDHHNIV